MGYTSINLIFFVAPDHEHIAHRLIVGRSALSRIARDRRGQHAIELRHVVIDVGNHWVVWLGLGKIYRLAGKRTQALEHVTTATAIYCNSGMKYWLEQAQAEMRQLQQSFLRARIAHKRIVCCYNAMRQLRGFGVPSSLPVTRTRCPPRWYPETDVRGRANRQCH